MEIGFILTAHSRIDDLLAHIDILKYFPRKYSLIPIWMKQDVPAYFEKEMARYPHAHFCDGKDFGMGPLLGLLSGLTKASEIGLDYVVYRNGDDWLLNHDFCLQNFLSMHSKGADLAGYNWFTCNTMTEFAMNELYMRVDKFAPRVEDGYQYFTTSSQKLLCEVKISKWIRSITTENQFMRLPDREHPVGIGYEPATLPTILTMTKQQVDDDFWLSLRHNNRFFNEKWQMIGSHDNNERLNYYKTIRPKVAYCHDLEKQPHFSRWLRTFETKEQWNLRSEEREKFLLNRRNQCDMLMKKLPKRLLGWHKQVAGVQKKNV